MKKTWKKQGRQKQWPNNIPFSQVAPYCAIVTFQLPSCGSYGVSWMLNPVECLWFCSFQMRCLSWSSSIGGYERMELFWKPQIRRFFKLAQFQKAFWRPEEGDVHVPTWEMEHMQLGMDKRSKEWDGNPLQAIQLRWRIIFYLFHSFPSLHNLLHFFHFCCLISSLSLISLFRLSAFILTALNGFKRVGVSAFQAEIFHFPNRVLNFCT